MTLFGLMVVNNWWIIMEGFQDALDSNVSRAFFICFHLATVVSYNYIRIYIYVYTRIIFKIVYLKREWGLITAIKRLPAVTNLSNSLLANTIAETIEMLQDFIPTLAGKVNVTEAKVGIKSCRFY